MGSLIAYELYYEIKKHNIKTPKHIFFSGYKAPSTISDEENIHSLPSYDFMKKVIELGGTSDEIISNTELFEMFLPILQNDFKILEEYEYKEKKEKIECDVSILYGKEDSINSEDILAWREHVLKGFKIYNFEGNHFFITSNIENVTNIINKTLIE